MRRFVAEQNIRHFRQILQSETDLSLRVTVRELLGEAERELAEAERELAELENAPRSEDAETLRIANDDGEQGYAQRSRKGGCR